MLDRLKLSKGRAIPKTLYILPCAGLISIELMLRLELRQRPSMRINEVERRAELCSLPEADVGEFVFTVPVSLFSHGHNSIGLTSRPRKRCIAECCDLGAHSIAMRT